MMGATSALSFTGSMLKHMKAEWAGILVIVAAISSGWVARDIFGIQADVPNRLDVVERTLVRHTFKEVQFDLLLRAICSDAEPGSAVVRACIMIEGIEQQRGESGPEN